MPAIKLMKYVEKKKINRGKSTRKRAQARMHSQATHAHLFLRFCAVRFITGIVANRVRVLPNNSIEYSWI